MTKAGPIELPLKKVTIIKEDDAGIIDLLCDLKVPTLMPALEDMVKNITVPGIMIISSPATGMVVLFVNKPPVFWQKEEYKYMAIASPDLASLVQFFEKWLSSSINVFERGALQSILNLLYSKRNKNLSEQEKP